LKISRSNTAVGSKLLGSKLTQTANKVLADSIDALKATSAKRFMMRPSGVARTGAERHQFLHPHAGGGRGLYIGHHQIKPAFGRRAVAGARGGQHQEFAGGVTERAIVGGQRLQPAARLLVWG